MFSLSETAKISYHYEPFTTAEAIFRETDRTNLYSQYLCKIVSNVASSQLPYIDISLRRTYAFLSVKLKSSIERNVFTMSYIH